MAGAPAGPDEWIDGVRAALVPLADATQAVDMAAYLRDQFQFLGVKAGERRMAQRPFLADAAQRSGDELMALAEAAWGEPEREFQYVAADLLRKGARRLGPEHLDRVEGLIRATPWWDTVDPLAIHVVGPLVRRHPELSAEMDHWVALDDGDPTDLWVRRSAVLHQLMAKDTTDADQLFAHCAGRLEESDFFMRKAVGWALRQYARTDPGAVRAFVVEHEAEISPLSRREALKHIGEAEEAT